MSGPTGDAAGPREPAGLVYYSDDRPGITRRRRGRGFSYHAPDGTLVRDPAERRRFEAIAVPPAYRSVWITPKPRGHLQATGRDARGRKQYRYHPDWQAMRARHKYDGLAAFGRALPALRARIDAGLRAEAGSRELALTAVLALLDRAAIRVGTPDYARDNNSYGATTLLEQYVRFDGDSVTLDFPGKGGAAVTRQLRGAPRPFAPGTEPMPRSRWRMRRARSASGIWPKPRPGASATPQPSRATAIFTRM